MVPELGHFSLILALCLSVAISLLPLIGSYTQSTLLMQSGKSLAVGLFVFTAIAFAALVWSFVNDDFSVAFVASHSNSLLPLRYKLTSVWGGHEGSLLLWTLLLASWLIAVSLFSGSLSPVFRARVISIMGMTIVGMLLFTLFTSNPFERILPGPPPNGNDLNPLLQDVGFIIHPPILFTGYSGFSVAFAFAVATLLSGRVDSAWARWSRPWTNVAWAFLTLGVGAGSWWAYYELGWGFWWGWDPTENNVLIPWLTATALVHSLAVTEKRGLFKSWTLLLAVCTFSLILLATFPARSGILTSVHAFASDPERGYFLLAYLFVVIVGSLLLYALRAPPVASLSSFKLSSRETFLLLNNILLSVTMAVVFLGTYYPLASDFFGLGKVSVGAGYFNPFWVMLTVPLCIFLGMSSVSQWRQTPAKLFVNYFSVPLIASAVLALLLPLVLAEDYKWGAVLTLFVAFWILLATLAGVLRQTRHAPSLWAGLKQLRVAYYSMVVAHIGVAAVVAAAGLNSVYKAERKIIFEPGVTQQLFGYDWTFNGVTQVRGPNYIAQEGEVVVSKNDRIISTLKTQQRQYFSGMPTTEAGIHSMLWRDLYVSLAEAIKPVDKGAWAITIYIKPMMWFLWFGIILISIGGFMALIDKRYRMARRVKEAATSSVPGRNAELEQALS